MTDADYLERFEERAAVREYDGNVSRSRAEYLAARDVKEEYGFVPDCILERIKNGKA